MWSPLSFTTITHSPQPMNSDLSSSFGNVFNHMFQHLDGVLLLFWYDIQQSNSVFTCSRLDLVPIILVVCLPVVCVRILHLMRLFIVVHSLLMSIDGHWMLQDPCFKVFVLYIYVLPSVRCKQNAGCVMCNCCCVFSWCSVLTVLQCFTTMLYYYAVLLCCVLCYIRCTTAKLFVAME